MHAKQVPTHWSFPNRISISESRRTAGRGRAGIGLSEVIRGMRGKTVTIRTADLGGDKMPSKEALALLGEAEFDEENPALGLRGLRFAFTHRPFFITQLRAIMRAATSAPEGTVRILLPW